MRVLILVNGDPPSASLAQRLAGEHDLLLAADGAAHRAQGLGLIPDIVCGDYDSIRLEVARAEFPRARFLPTPDQDFADLEKALAIAQNEGATRITILGAAGGRIDHALANYALLLAYADRAIAIVDDLATVRAVAGRDETPGLLEIATERGDTISLLSFDGKACVSLAGVRWTLDDVRLPIGTHGVSNVAEAERVTVRVRDGAILVCHLRPVFKTP